MIFRLRNSSISVKQITPSQKPFGFFGISALRGADLREANLRCASQKPFGFFGISAGPKRTALISLGLTSQKPFGFFGISANINFVQIPNTVITVTKAFRLLWHFCPGMQSVEHVQLPARSQKPFGFFGISAKEQQERNRMAQKPCHKSLSASLAFLPKVSQAEMDALCKESHKSLSASLAFLPDFIMEKTFAQRSHKSLSASLAFLPYGMAVNAMHKKICHKSLSASLAFLPGVLLWRP